MADSSVLQLECAQGEDAVWQFFWQDEYGEPVPVSNPILMDVKDANGQIAMRFATNADLATQAAIELSSSNGFIQITAPASVTATLVPGRYLWDMFASVADSAAPFQNQLQQVVSGWLVVDSRVTRIEQAPEAVTSGSPSGN